MSTAPRAKPETLPPLRAGERLDQPTFHERYEAMPPETRAELVGGVVYVPSPMRQDHGKPSQFIAGWLFQYECQTPGIEGYIGTTVKLDLKGEPQPDHLLLIPAELGGQSGVDADNYLTAAPELVVEVARSSRRYDLTKKKVDYERAGVLEYLVAELDPDRIHWFVRRGDHFEVLRPGRDGIHRSEAFPGLWLDSKALFTEDRARLVRVLKRGLRSPEHAAFAARLARVRRTRKPR
jgi:Uma2 family endonuclease